MADCFVSFLLMVKLKLRGTNRATRKLSQQEPCLLVEKHILVEKGAIPTKPPRRWQCMLSEQDAMKSQTWIADLDGINDDELDLDDNVKSGITSLFVEGSEIVLSESKIIIPTNGKKVLRQNDEVTRNKRSLSVGATVNSVLAIRVIAADASTTSSMEEMRDNFFYDELSLGRKFYACSYGRTQMEPFNGKTVTGYDVDRGVVEVTIGNSISDGSDIRNAVEGQATALLGDLASQFDFVMFIMVRSTRRSRIQFTVHFLCRQGAVESQLRHSWMCTTSVIS